MAILQLIEPEVKDLGGFVARRSLPYPQRQMVGPFIFFDHVGPSVLPPNKGIDVRPHPHINLATVTYLFDGALMHRDSLGTVQSIQPGAVNWMTAGKGIVHSGDFQGINYSKKNKRQVFSRMIIILRGEKRGCRGQPLFSPSSMHEESIHLSSALKLNSVNKGCFVAKEMLLLKSNHICFTTTNINKPIT